MKRAKIDEELNFLKNEVASLKLEIYNVERRIEKLTATRKPRKSKFTGRPTVRRHSTRTD